ncbi:Gfo/Idh/MocA family protein [Glaesserella parasuis]|uniref:Gfo/Idh/MocA family protein n=1 Tax=Glaesserella parasuis TaxID=738 RepID=UPI003CEFE2C8
MNRIKIALIGCGFFGKQLAYSFHKMDGELVGFTDLDFNLANQLAEKYQSVAYPNIDDLLINTQPDLVLIATYNYAHKQPAITALNHNAHIFIETPFTIDSQESQEIMQLALEKK